MASASNPSSQVEVAANDCHDRPRSEDLEWIQIPRVLSSDSTGPIWIPQLHYGASGYSRGDPAAKASAERYALLAQLDIHLLPAHQEFQTT
jgi:hypothetical protein